MVLTLNDARQGYDALKELDLKLTTARGVPGNDQVELSKALFHRVEGDGHFMDLCGNSLLNYGPPTRGLDPIRRTMASIMGVEMEESIVAWTSSLKAMNNYMDFRLGEAITELKIESVVRGIEMKPKFLCPVPGYDRHFTICDRLGLEMISVPLGPDGPDLNMCEELVQQDPTILGIWCVPRFSNPTGCTYSNENLDRLSKLGGMAQNKAFVAMFDNAYAVHELSGEEGQKERMLPSIMEMAKRNGTEDSIAIFTSFAKVLFAGSSSAAIGLSTRNADLFVTKYLETMQICPDKPKQFAESQALPDLDAVLEHMRGQARLLRPKFDGMLAGLNETLSPAVGATIDDVEGGYFLSLYLPPEVSANRVVELAKGLGVVPTGAEAAFPKGQSPDNHMRLAPSALTPENARLAGKVIGASVNLAASE